MESLPEYETEAMPKVMELHTCLYVCKPIFCVYVYL